MTLLLAQRIKVPFNDDSIKIAGLEWGDTDRLTVAVKSRRSGRSCKVYFESIEGIRMLHELNLASWWLSAQRQELAGSWLHEVQSAGWFDFEATRPDFYSQHETKIPEYLVAGCQECLSIFSHSQPVVTEARV
jgi:hypothetical protein